MLSVCWPDSNKGCLSPIQSNKTGHCDLFKCENKKNQNKSFTCLQEGTIKGQNKVQVIDPKELKS